MDLIISLNRLNSGSFFDGKGGLSMFKWQSIKTKIDPSVAQSLERTCIAKRSSRRQYENE